MLSVIVRLALLGAVLLAAGCAERGFVTIHPGAAGVGAVEPIYVATSRTASEGADIFGRERAKALGFGRFEVAVPPEREPGSLNFPDAAPADPRTDFVTAEAARFADDRAFLAAVNAGLRAQAGREKRVFVFVHGFNTNFAEGIYRQAQMMHDFGTPALGVHYAWPSAADARLYLYDRDSAFFARDGMERLLRLIGESEAERIVLVAHSMGAQVALEALRQMALVGAPRFFGKLQAVALLSPDVDVDLFRSEVAPLATMDIPWFIFVSSHDRALRASSFLRGQKARLGSLVDPEALEGLDVTVIDMSEVEGGDALNHSVVAASPVMISLVQGLSRYGTDILEHDQAKIGLAATTANVVQSVTEVVVSPLAGVAAP
jgi:esterase/lipase superfamily enzyme